MDESCKSENVSDDGMEGRHGFVERKNHVEKGLTQISHQSSGGDENDKGRVKVEQGSSTARKRKRGALHEARCLIIMPCRGSSNEEETEIEKCVYNKNSECTSIDLKCWFNARKGALKPPASLGDHDRSGKEFRRDRSDARNGAYDGSK